MSEFVTAGEALAAWDDGRSVWTVEMGGLGPDYEQAIHVLTFELLRASIGKPLPPDGTSMDGWGAETVHRVNDWPGCSFSGAQVGAAKWLAFRYLTRGHKAALDEFRAKDAGRLMLVSRAWPHDPAAKAAP